MFERVSSDEGRPGGGGRKSKVAVQAGGAAGGAGSLFANDALAISPVTALTKGVVVSLMAASCVWLCVALFRWGLSRYRKKSVPLRQRVAIARARIRRGIRRAIRRARRSCCCCRRVELDAGPAPMAAPEAPRGVRESAAAFDATAGPEIIEDAHACTSASHRSSPQITEDEITEITELGWLLLLVGCVICPGFNLLALCFCRRKRAGPDHGVGTTAQQVRRPAATTKVAPASDAMELEREGLSPPSISQVARPVTLQSREDLTSSVCHSRREHLLTSHFSLLHSHVLSLFSLLTSHLFFSLLAAYCLLMTAYCCVVGP